MKIVVLVCRILLGLVFFVFGLDKFFHFMGNPQLPAGAAGQFLGALFATKYIWFVGLCEVIGGLLLLLNRYVPLGLVILGPIIVNILLTGILMTRMALGSGIVVTILWFVVYSRHRAAFAGIFAAKS